MNNRQSIRLKNYDYSQPGCYFVTICTHNMMCLLGEIVNAHPRLSAIGEITDLCWQEIPKHFPHVSLDEYVIMPNHMHGIIIINNNTSSITKCNT